MKRVAITVVLVIGLAGAASAQFAVFDPVNYANALLRYAELEQQYAQLVTTYQQIRTQYLLLRQQAQSVPAVQQYSALISQVANTCNNY